MPELATHRPALGGKERAKLPDRGHGGVLVTSTGVDEPGHSHFAGEGTKVNQFVQKETLGKGQRQGLSLDLSTPSA